MAKGLFSVYRDPGMSDPAPAPSTRSTSSHNNPSSSRRRDAIDPSSSLRTAKLREKENIDPFAHHGAEKAGLAGKGGKKPALGAKKAIPVGSEVSCAGKMGRSAIGAVSGKAKPLSLNGICTGTLRTKVLPDSLFSEDRSSTSPADSAPQVVEIYPSSSNTSPRLSGSWGGSHSSPAADSGYARSLSGRASDSDLDVAGGSRRFTDESDGEAEASDYEANRRARALTESPLAEITQAFTGLGGFSTANMSPSPSPSQASFPSRPPAPTRTRSSPSKTTLSAVPPRMQPYSTTATTKRVKSGQTGAGAPRGVPTARTLRF
ncbi:hypothetical protein JCM11251_002967 [Rhodosporidiobolus azoricus]